RTQFGDISFGSKNLLSLLAQASLLGQKTSYYQKWQVHRRGRPEAFGARIDVHLSGRKSYDLHSAILESDGLARTKARFRAWLLPQAYPEGCPPHPSYPAAHAVNSGACATVLKAFFDEGHVIADPVEASADGVRLQRWRGVRDRQTRRKHRAGARCCGGALPIRQHSRSQARRRGRDRSPRGHQPYL